MQNNLSELVIIENNVFNKYIQFAINDFMSARTKFAYQILTNQKHLATMYDTSGNIIQPIHDFTSNIYFEKFVVSNNYEKE